MSQASEEAAATLRASHRLAAEAADDFRIMNQADFIEMQNSTANTLTVFIASIALVSLIVGGIGIMNIMLVSVTERTREIGLRKAIGARNKDILVQFLVEAVLLSVLGGLIGIGFGSLMAFGISKINIFEGLSWEFQVPLYSIILSFCFSAIIGVASGYYPARRAAKLDPIEALRYE
jgi:putative ABC transport system permease protein